MKAISDLKEIIKNQKTIRTTRLESYVTEIGKAYSGSGAKIAQQQKTIDELGRRLQKLTHELNKLKGKRK